MLKFFIVAVYFIFLPMQYVSANANPVMTPIINYLLSNDTWTIYNTFGVGFGASSSFEFQDDNNNSIYVSSTDLMLDKNISDNNYYKNIKNFDADSFTDLQRYLSKSKYFAIWVTKGWEEYWFNVDDINKAVLNGKIPVFIYWYFGDHLGERMPTEEEIVEYRDDTIRFKSLMDNINGKKIVILEPEFNKQPVLDNPDNFVQIISNAIDVIKDDTIAISLCMTDTGNRSEDEVYEKCGYENCALGDKYEWSLSRPIYDALLPKLDFISFQEMLGQFSRDPSNPGTWENPNPISYTDAEIGIDKLPLRLENISTYLYELYKKPIFLPYMTIASATWNDSDSDGEIDDSEIDKDGFSYKANQVYKNIDRVKLQQNHLFGFMIMELFDIPDHDKGGYQYFMQNEYNLGIVRSSAVDTIDNAINGDITFKSDILENIFK